MKVLFLYPRALDPSKSVGGVAEFLYSVTPALHSLGIEPVVYAGSKEKTTLSGPVYIKDHIPVYTGPFLKPGFFISKKRVAPVLALCKELEISLTHAQGTYTAGFMALQIYKHLRIPYLITSHSDILPINSKRITRGNVRRRCRKILANAGAVTHLTPMMESASHAIWNTQSKSTIIGNGIDCSVWKPYTNLPEKNYMLGIGRLEPGKGFHILISMYTDLVKRGIKTSLIIAGKGTAEKALHEQARKTGLNVYFDFKDFEQIPEKSILFTGYVRGEDKHKLIAQSQAVLFAIQPQLWEEAFGIVQLEAMAAAKSIIASDTNVTHYLCAAGMQALIVKPDDIQDWVNQTASLLADPTLRSQYGKANLAAAAHFDWHPIAKQYKDVYLMLQQK